MLSHLKAWLILAIVAAVCHIQQTLRAAGAAAAGRTPVLEGRSLPRDYCAASGSWCACGNGTFVGGRDGVFAGTTPPPHPVHECPLGREGPCRCLRRAAPPLVKILQTSDGTNSSYERYLHVTAPRNAAYAERHGYAYEAFRGVRLPRGRRRGAAVNLLANLNRVPLLEDELARGTTDWVLYLDSDAVIHGDDVSLGQLGLLDPSHSFAFCEGGAQPWNVNSGVMLANLRHAETGPLLARWRAAIEERAARRSKIWVSDQRVLHSLLRADPRAARSIQVFRGADRDRFNFVGGPLVTHVMRSTVADAAAPARKGASADYRPEAAVEADAVARRLVLLREAAGPRQGAAG